MAETISVVKSIDEALEQLVGLEPLLFVSNSTIGHLISEQVNDSSILVTGSVYARKETIPVQGLFPLSSKPTIERISRMKSNTHLHSAGYIVAAEGKFTYNIRALSTNRGSASLVVFDTQYTRNPDEANELRTAYPNIFGV